MHHTAAVSDIWDRAQYADGAPHEVFAELRRTSPVHWQDIPGQEGYWALLTHEHVDWASRHPELLSSSEGGITVEDMDDAGLAGMRQMLLGMDPPRHREMRKPLVPEFSKKVISGLEPMVRGITRDVLGEVDESSVVDVVAVAGQLPTRIVGGMLGLPREDWDHLHHLAAASARSVSGEAEDANNDAIAELATYAFGHAASRRALAGDPRLRYANPLDYFRRTRDRPRDRRPADRGAAEGRHVLHGPERCSAAPSTSAVSDVRDRRASLAPRPAGGPGLLRRAPGRVPGHRARRRPARTASNFNNGLDALPVRVAALIIAANDHPRDRRDAAPRATMVTATASGVHELLATPHPTSPAPAGRTAGEQRDHHDGDGVVHERVAPDHGQRMGGDEQSGTQDGHTTTDAPGTGRGGTAPDEREQPDDEEHLGHAPDAALRPERSRSSLHRRGSAVLIRAPSPCTSRDGRPRDRRSVVADWTDAETVGVVMSSTRGRRGPGPHGTTQPAAALHVGQPRRDGVRRPAALRHPPVSQPAHLVRDRRGPRSGRGATTEDPSTSNPTPSRSTPGRGLRGDPAARGLEDQVPFARLALARRAVSVGLGAATARPRRGARLSWTAIALSAPATRSGRRAVRRRAAGRRRASADRTATRPTQQRAAEVRATVGPPFSPGLGCVAAPSPRRGRRGAIRRRRSS